VTHWFIDKIASWGDRAAFVFGDRIVSHREFAELVRQWSDRLDGQGIGGGDVVVVHGDYSPAACALIFALAARRAIVTPLSPLPRETLEQRCTTAGANCMIEFSPDGAPRFEQLAPAATPDLVVKLRDQDRAGLILFSSGSAGAPKACLLDLDSLLETTRKERKGYVTLIFLLFDHIGGINTMINVLGHGGTAVVVADRAVDTVARAIGAAKVELLPTSPTFLKMLLISDAASRFDLTSLKLITYGTEVMPKATLEGLHQAFPDAVLKQTYGLSEIGIVPTRSRAPDSLWMQIGGANVEHKIVDGLLWIRASTAMLGYLNAPSPFDADGWLNTRDKVEVDGDFIRIIGRESELINVGGEKVHPAEVENVLLRAGNIRDVTVAARSSPVTGSVVIATVSLIEVEDLEVLRRRLDRFCREWLEPYKVPAMFKISDEPLHSMRFKKIRAQSA
jgi:acyl-CoA synthetase (AMP-forming)/AMP-acid ligase II